MGAIANTVVTEDAIPFWALVVQAALVAAQVGPEPDAASVPGRQLQWAALHRIQSRSQRADACAGLLEIVGLFVVKVRT